MTYQGLAALLSAIGVVVYSVLIAIAFLRARYGRPVGPKRLLTTTVVEQARRVEGPVFTMLLVACVALLGSALTIGSDDAAELGRLFRSVARGFLVVQGLFVLAYYWQVRETWL